MGHFQSLYWRCGFLELWTEGHWRLLWWQQKKLLMETSSDGGCQAEGGGLQGLAVLEDL